MREDGRGLRWGRRGPVVAGLLLAAVLSVVPAVLPPVPAAGAADPPTRLAGSIVGRNAAGWRVSACVEHPNGTAEPDATSRVLVDGTQVPGLSPPLAYSLPPLEPPHPFRAADCPVSNGGWWVDFQLTSAQVAAAGVTAPAPGAWTTFSLTVELTAGGATSSTTRTVDYGRGDPVVTLSGLTTSWEGMRIRGEAVDPEASDGTRFVVLVDGAVQGSGVVPFGASVDVDRRWYDRELGLAHQIDVTVPFGSQACVVLVESVGGDWAPTQLAGCLTGASGLPTGRIERMAAGPGTITVVGWLFQPTLPYPAPPTDPRLPGPDSFRNSGTVTVDGAVVVGSSFSAQWWRNDVAAANPGNYNAWSGFQATVRAEPGWHRVCIAKQLTDWRGFAVPPPAQVVADCVDRVLVPPAWNVLAEGSLDQLAAIPGGVAVRGWAADRNGGRPWVLVSVDGVPVRLFEPTLWRPDVYDLIGGDPASGFDEPVAVRPGSHLVCVAWEDTGGAGWNLPACGRVVVK